MVRGHGLEPGSLEQRLDACGGEVHAMSRDVQMQPSWPADPCLRRRDVRHAREHQTARPQPAKYALERLTRLVEVLEHVPEHHGVQTLVLVILDPLPAHRPPGGRGPCCAARGRLDALSGASGPRQRLHQTPRARSGV